MSEIQIRATGSNHVTQTMSTRTPVRWQVKDWVRKIKSWVSEVKDWVKEVKSWVREVKDWVGEVKSWVSEVKDWVKEVKSKYTKMTTENRARVVTLRRVKRVCAIPSSLLNSRTLCRMTDSKNSTSGCCATSTSEDPTSGSGHSGASKLMTSLPVAVAVLNIRSVSTASDERCIESRELVKGESRDPVMSHVTQRWVRCSPWLTAAWWLHPALTILYLHTM